MKCILFKLKYQKLTTSTDLDIADEAAAFLCGDHDFLTLKLLYGGSGSVGTGHL